MSNTQNQSSEGGCTCGAVRYRMTGSPIFVHCCHCSYCQQQSGSAFAVNAMIEASNITLLQGQLETINTPTTSGRGQKIHRCSNCKIAVWSNYGGAGDKVHFVRVGTLDDKNAFQPDIHIYTSTKQGWVEIAEGKPVVQEYYKSSEHWSEESQARMKALTGG
jgi:hypothetical protein